MPGPNAFDLELKFGGKRYTDAKAGLHAIARQMERNVKSFNPHIRRQLRDLLDTVAEAMAQRHSTPWSSGRRMPVGAAQGRLQRRSGRAMRMLAAGVAVVGTGDNTVGRLHGPRYLAVHEKGATVSAKRAKYLAIPLPAALTKTGVPKKRRPREWKNTFVQRSRRGNLIIFQKRGGTLIPLYVLKKSVSIPPRLGLGATTKIAIPVFEDRLFDRLMQAMREK